MDMVEKQKFIFGNLFLLANKLQAIGDQYLRRDGITIKQWFLTVIISQFCDNPPTLSEVAGLMGSSRQNVKQLALKLKEKGFLEITRDEQDARALRLKPTERSRLFWEERSEQDNQFVMDLFSEFTDDEINVTFNSFIKLADKIQELERIYIKLED